MCQLCSSRTENDGPDPLPPHICNYPGNPSLLVGLQITPTGKGYRIHPSLIDS